MKKGDIVKCNHWIHEGKKGLIIQVQSELSYCIGAYVLLECGLLKLIRLENLELVCESG